MAGKVIRELAEYLIIAFVAFALLFEIVLHKLEHWVMHRHPHIQTMLRNLYREIMILGIISFCFIMYIFIESPVDDVKMTFEVSHVWVFLFAVFHTFVVGLCIYISLGLSKRWKNFERMDLIKYLEQKEKYNHLNDRRNKHANPIWRHLGWWLTSPGKYFQYSKLHEAMAFHDIRWQFIYYRNLSNDFRFSKYLRKIKFATFVELVEINPILWIFLIILIGIDLLRWKIGSHPNFEAFFLIAHSCLNMILITLVARKIRRVYWKLTKNPATYYDNIDPAAFRAELKIAEEEERIRREIGEAESFNDISSRGKGVRLPPPRESQDGSEKSSHHHQAIHHNMAYVPENHVPDTRYSLDVSKAMPGGGGEMKPIDSSVKPARYTPRISTSRMSADELIATAKRVHQRQSVDIPSLDIPVKELDHRARPSVDIQLDDHLMKRVSSSRRNLRMEALRRLRMKKERNAAIVETAQDVQAAQNASPKKQYHWLIVKLFPRLGRVASAAEKLFWFGSHRYYLFCVEFLLFFTNINLSTAIAKLAFNYKERKYIESKAKTAVRFLTSEVVRAAADPKKSTSTKKDPKNDPFAQSLPLLWLAFTMGLIAMFYVLLRIADIMKKYIFVLNNANLLSETMTTQTIHTVSLKDAMEEETMRGHDPEDRKPMLNAYDSDTEEDDFQDYSQMRRNLSNFFETEGTNGLATGAGAGETTPLSPGLMRGV